MPLPNYFQPEDIEDRLERKVVFFSSEQIPLTFGPTTDPNWWCIIQVNEVYGQRILSPVAEVRVRSEDDTKYMRKAMQNYCERMHIPWRELEPEEKIQRKSHKPLADEEDAAKIALMRWAQSQN